MEETFLMGFSDVKNLVSVIPWQFRKRKKNIFQKNTYDAASIKTLHFNI